MNTTALAYIYKNAIFHFYHSLTRKRKEYSEKAEQLIMTQMDACQTN